MCMSSPSVPKPIPAQEIKQPVIDALRRRKAPGMAGGPGAGGVSMLAGTGSSLAAGGQTASTSMLGG